jgi:hypothetical protein
MRAEPHTFPELRSRLKEILNVPWEGVGLGRLRVGRVKYRYVSGFSLAAAFLDGLFEHPAGPYWHLERNRLFSLTGLAKPDETDRILHDRGTIVLCFDHIPNCIPVAPIRNPRNFFY